MQSSDVKGLNKRDGDQKQEEPIIDQWNINGAHLYFVLNNCTRNEVRMEKTNEKGEKKKEGERERKRETKLEEKMYF